MDESPKTARRRELRDTEEARKKRWAANSTLGAVEKMA
jgi:hypothetical protein